MYAMQTVLMATLDILLGGLLAIFFTPLDGSAACVNVAQSPGFVLVHRNGHSLSSTECYSIPLEYVPDYLNNSMILEFNTSELTLTTLLSIEGKKNITLIGLDGGTKISCYPPDVSNHSNTGAGLAFIAIQNLTLANLTFEKCGALQSTNTIGHPNTSVTKFQCTIYILNSSNISIANVVIRNSSGTGVAIFNTFGIVNIENSYFEWNRVPASDTLKYSGGGGVYLELFCCNDELLQMTFQACYFLDNNASTDDPDNAAFVAPLDYQGMARGGGLCLKVQSATIIMNISDCVFKRNSAFWGGGLYLTLRDGSSNSKIYISNVTFDSNICYRFGGGGAKIHYMFADSRPLKNNLISLENCTFVNNTANFGGGVVFFSSQRCKSCPDLNNTIQFLNCTWRSNTAYYGAAINIEPPIWNTPSTGLLPVPVFQSCTFISNQVIDEEMYKCDEFCVQSEHGKGAFLATGYTIQFKGTLHYEGNNGSAMYIVSSILEFAAGADIHFVDNSGYEGGAIALIAFSSILVSENCTFEFTNNSALLRGGAIFSQSVDSYDYVSSCRCFIQLHRDDYNKIYGKTNVIFSFNENWIRAESEVNSDNQYGSSIFASTIHPCRHYCSSYAYGGEKSDNPFKCIGKFIYNNKSTYKNESSRHDISTYGEVFIVTDQCKSLPLQVIPGKSFKLPIALKDDFQNTVPDVYHVTVNNTGNSRRISTDRLFTYTNDMRIVLFGNPGDNGNIILSRRGSREISLSLGVQIQQCPPGYIHDNKSRKCVCSSSLEFSYKGIYSCNPDRFCARIHRGYWIGYVDNETEYSLVTGYCPFRFCFPAKKLALKCLPDTASNTSSLDRFVCGSNRTGILCSKCRGNLSVHYHSGNFDCKSNNLCKIGWLLYILSELLPLTIFFVFVIVFDISCTSGATNGFIFFAQVMDSLHITAYDFIWFPKPVSLLTDLYRFIYRIFNLDFFSISGLSFCLWESASTLDILAFKFVTIIYALLLVIATVKLMNTFNFYRWCPSLKRNPVKSYVIHGLSALLVMCYAQCTKVSLFILDSADLTSKGRRYVRKVVFFQGNVDYFSREHLPYAVPALVCIATIVALPPIVLLVYPMCYRILALFRLNNSHFFNFTSRFVSLARLKPFLDSFQSCFKDNYRFFAGLYFVYRLVLFATASIVTSFTRLYMLMEVELILFLAFHAIAQPYEKKWQNILDCFLFANLAIINGLTLHNYTRARSPSSLKYKHTIDVISSIQLVLIYLPMIYMVGYMTCHLFWGIKGLLLTRKHKNGHSQPQDDIELPARLILSDTSNSAREDLEYQQYQQDNINN